MIFTVSIAIYLFSHWSSQSPCDFLSDNWCLTCTVYRWKLQFGGIVKENVFICPVIFDVNHNIQQSIDIQAMETTVESWICYYRLLLFVSFLCFINSHYTHFVICAVGYWSGSIILQNMNQSLGAIMMLYHLTKYYNSLSLIPSINVCT